MLKRIVLALAMLALVVVPAQAGVGTVAKSMAEEVTSANFVVGVSGDPANLNTSAFSVLITANREGFEVAKNFYVLGVGLDFAMEFGVDLQGVGASMPVITYRPNGGNFVVQGGYARGLTGDVKGDNRVYLGIGFTRK